MNRLDFRRQDVVLLVLTMGAALLCTMNKAFRPIDYPASLVLTPIFWLTFAFHAAASPPSGAAGVRRSLVLLVLASSGSLLILAVAGLATEICDPAYGLAFFALGPVAGGFVGLGWGLVSSLLIRNRWLSCAAVALAALASLAVAVGEFWFTPSVRFYSNFFGLYSGAIYDEDVFIKSPYLWLRLRDLLAASSALLWTWWPDRRQRLWALPGIVLALGLTAASPWLGFLSSTGRLQAELSQLRETDHLRLHCRPGGRQSRNIDSLAVDLEFRFHQIQDMYNLPEPNDKLDIWLYESQNQKAALMGAGRTSIAKPWRREVHVHSSRAGDTLLAHELAHAMLADLSGSWLGVPTSGLFPKPGIMEGAAEAVERGGERMTLHEATRAMRDLGKRPDLEAILTGLSFWSHAGPTAYTASGSFVLWLISEKGPAPVSLLYGGQSFEEAFGVPLASLLTDWDAFLDTVELSREHMALAQFVFSQPSVFAKTCPHAAARCIRMAAAAAARNDGSSALSHSRNALFMTHGDPRVGRDAAAVAFLAGHHIEGLEMLSTNPGVELSGAPATVVHALHLMEADAQWSAGDARFARRLYDELAGDSEAALFLGDGLKWRRCLAATLVPQPVRRLVTGSVTRESMGEVIQKLNLSDLTPVARLWTLTFLMNQTENPEERERALVMASEFCTARGRDAFVAAFADLQVEGLEQADIDRLYFSFALGTARNLALTLDVSRAQETMTFLNTLSPPDQSSEEAVADLAERVNWMQKNSL